MKPPSQRAILDLANAHGSDSERAAHHFTKRDLLKFAAALLDQARPPADSARLDALAAAAGFIPTDTVRLDTLSSTGGFIRGMADGATAYRIFGTDIWHADLRVAIDQELNIPATTACADNLIK